MLNKEKRVRYRFTKIVKVANVKTDERVLDLGCGKNILLKYLPRVIYTGLDRNNGYDLEKGLPDNLPEFDVIFLNEFIEHIENFKTLLIQCRDILSDNGRIIISTPSNYRILIGEDKEHIHCFRKTNMMNLARICGLKVVETSGTYIRFPPLLKHHVIIPTDQTIYSENIVYRLEVK